MVGLCISGVESMAILSEYRQPKICDHGAVMEAFIQGKVVQDLAMCLIQVI